MQNQYPQERIVFEHRLELAHIRTLNIRAEEGQSQKKKPTSSALSIFPFQSFQTSRASYKHVDLRDCPDREVRVHHTGRDDVAQHFHSHEEPGPGPTKGGLHRITAKTAAVIKPISRIKQICIRAARRGRDFFTQPNARRNATPNPSDWRKKGCMQHGRVCCDTSVSSTGNGSITRSCSGSSTESTGSTEDRKSAVDACSGSGRDRGISERAGDFGNLRTTSPAKSSKMAHFVFKCNKEDYLSLSS
jgi:hypothetical protein